MCIESESDVAILSQTDHAFFTENGYVTVPEAVPQSILEASVEAICAYLGIDGDNPNTWYRLDLGQNGIVPLHHSQAFRDNRQHPRVYEIFSEILGVRKLWVTMDRASFKPRIRGEWSTRRDDSPFHWDRDPFDPRGSWVQDYSISPTRPPNKAPFSVRLEFITYRTDGGFEP